MSTTCSNTCQSDHVRTRVGTARGHGHAVDDTGEHPRDVDAARPAHGIDPTSEGRRRNMRAIRRTGTKPELALRSALHRAGYRFRKDLLIRTESGVRARPDIVFTKQRVAVFVDGCFWHGCPEHGGSPRRNTAYWGPKLRRNIERDEDQVTALTSDGWTVLRIWEHVPTDQAVADITKLL
ncbi:very short patch repair endonuclease [Flexivirga caeni]|uniref:Very short patch repair endonuclease n=1 Tax=Flexivirga caeni TaxID=2294115 RepID=A0A3M9M855_9MICO|nr:very short patch repair endonuclease [Flexivirga caeni]RNI20728.1 very short patch repair endonuclease [Flexivirga caeni]